MYIEIPDLKGLREFGLITGAMFIGLFGLILPWLLKVTMPLWPWIIAGILWSLALLIPYGLKWIYYGWMLVAMGIGWINTRLILIIVFYLIMTPMGLLMRLFNQNPLKNKPSHVISYRHITQLRSPKHMEYPF